MKYFFPQKEKHMKEFYIKKSMFKQQKDDNIDKASIPVQAKQIQEASEDHNWHQTPNLKAMRDNKVPSMCLVPKQA